MEYPEGQLPELSASDSTLTTSTSAVMSFQDLKIPVDYGAETADDPSAKTAGDQGTQTPADHGAQADAGNGTQAAARTMGVLLERTGKCLYIPVTALPPPPKKKLRIFFLKKQTASIYKLCDTPLG